MFVTQINPKLLGGTAQSHEYQEASKEGEAISGDTEPLLDHPRLLWPLHP